jgi:alkyl hydroperoxide reductase subunit AhpC
VLVDVGKVLAGALGLEGPARRVQGRAAFVADPSGVIRWMGVSALPALRTLHDAVDAVDALRGAAHASGDCARDRRLIRACAWCQRLQDEAGWHAPENYIRRRTGAELTHGICGDCLHKQSPS